MPVLRFDPWEPDYGSSDLIDQETLPSPAVDLEVEAGDWQALTPAQPSTRPAIDFIDGVRRVEMHLVASEGETSAPAILGSFAVGPVRCAASSAVGEPRVFRRFILSGGLAGTAIPLRVGGAELLYEPVSVATSAPTDPLQRLQQEMLRAEGDLAVEKASSGDALVCRDGPLTFYQQSAFPVIGVVKRHVATYFDATHMNTVFEMQTGQRTPIFAFGNQALDRYAWYSRIAQPGPLEQALVGIVRCEVRCEWGLATARGLADTLAATLPLYASDSTRDSRAPQNLYPIGALEQQLRHRLGNPELIRRALIEHIHATGGVN